MRDRVYLLDSKKKLNDWIAQDRLSSGYSAVPSIKERIYSIVAPNYILRFERRLRIVEYLTNCKSSPIHSLLLFYNKLKLRKLQLRLGFTIPVNVFGPGLSIPHYGTIVVSQDAVVGNNCRIHCGVNIGASGGEKDAPVIGNNVYIGPGAILFGGIYIADNTTIGANATVNKSFTEKNVTIAGTPARVVKEGSSTWNSCE